MAPTTRSSTRTNQHVAVAVAQDPGIGPRKSKLAAKSFIKIQTMQILPRLPPPTIVRPKRLQRTSTAKKPTTSRRTLDQSNSGQLSKFKGTHAPENEENEDIKYDIPKVPVQTANFPTIDESAHLFVKQEVEVATEPFATGVIDDTSTGKIQVASEDEESGDDIEDADNAEEDSGDHISEEDTVQPATGTPLNASLEPLGHPRHTSTPKVTPLAGQTSINFEMYSTSPNAAFLPSQLQSSKEAPEAKGYQQIDYGFVNLFAPNDALF